MPFFLIIIESEDEDEEKELTIANKPKISNVKDLNELKKSRRITIMIIGTLFITIFGSLPKNVYVIYKYSTDSTLRIYNFSLISFLILNFASGLNFFIYVLFNKKFRQILVSYFRKIFFYCKN
jgi:hypothetical protein